MLNVKPSTVLIQAFCFFPPSDLSSDINRFEISLSNKTKKSKDPDICKYFSVKDAYIYICVYIYLSTTAMDTLCSFHYFCPTLPQEHQVCFYADHTLYVLHVWC